MRDVEVRKAREVRDDDFHRFVRHVAVRDVGGLGKFEMMIFIDSFVTSQYETSRITSAGQFAAMALIDSFVRLLHVYIM